MKIVLLAGGSSIHTIRWANGLTEAGLEVHLITQHPLLEPVNDRVAVTAFPYRGNLGYFLIVPAVRRLLRKLQPDVLNAHYASGYGTTARLAGFNPWMLSVWGSDVYDFPARSPVHWWWVRRNLMSANRVASTSRCMAEQTRKVAHGLKDIAITPFGVETERFRLASPTLLDREASRPIVIGTVKKMSPKYGVDTLIWAFAQVNNYYTNFSPQIAERLRLRLVGDGPQHKELKELAGSLGIAGKTKFVGRVPYGQVPYELSKLDIYVALSRLDSESFGVAVIEAGAAGRPVVVSDAGGLPEIVVPHETGIIVPRDDPDGAATALKRLIEDPGLRATMGEKGREHVDRHYSWQQSLRTMLNVLEATHRSKTW